MKQYNDKYVNVFYEDKNWRLYNEKTTTSLDALYSETQIKLIELVDQYNFKIFYFSCKPATINKLIIDNQIINLETEDVVNIKNNQIEDFYYIYKNQLCEVFYSFLKLDEDNNYYYDFMLIVNNNFKLNDIYNYNFKSIKIVSVKEIFYNDLTFELIQNIFEQRVITINNSVPVHEKEYYDLSNLEYGVENYLKLFNKSIDNWNLDEYINFDSFHYYSNFDQDRCAKSLFKLLCSQIWTLDRYFYKEKNKYGLRLTYEEKYDINSAFLTNFGEIVDFYSISEKKGQKIIEKKFYMYSCLCDNFSNQGLMFAGFHTELINKKLGDIKLENLKIMEKN